MKHILLATVAAATLSTTAFANNAQEICEGSADFGACVVAIETLETQEFLLEEAGFDSFGSAIIAATNPVTHKIEVPGETVYETVTVTEIMTVEVEVDADQSDLNAAWNKGHTAGYETGLEQSQGSAYSNGFDDGVNSGYADAFAQGQAAGSMAIEEASAAASAAGYAEGYEAGVVEGDVVGRELNRLLGDAIASYNVDDMKTYFNNPTDFVHSVYGQVANANEATANAQASADKAVAEANKTVSALRAKIKEMSAKMAKFERSAKHVVGWVKDYGPQSWIAEQANRLFKNLI